MGAGVGGVGGKKGYAGRFRWKCYWGCGVEVVCVWGGGGVKGIMIFLGPS